MLSYQQNPHGPVHDQILLHKAARLSIGHGNQDKRLTVVSNCQYNKTKNYFCSSHPGLGPDLLYKDHEENQEQEIREYLGNAYLFKGHY